MRSWHVIIMLLFLSVSVIAYDPSQTTILYHRTTNMSFNQSYVDNLYWRLDGTNAPPTADWNMGGYSIYNIRDINVTGNATFSGSFETGCLHCDGNDTYFHGSGYFSGDVTAPNIEVMESLIVHGNSSCDGTATACGDIADSELCGWTINTGQRGCRWRIFYGDCVGTATPCDEMSTAICEEQHVCTLTVGYNGFVIDGSGMSGNASINTTGNITANTYFGDGSNLEGVLTNGSAYLQNNTDAILDNLQTTGDVVMNGSTGRRGVYWDASEDNLLINGTDNSLYPYTLNVLGDGDYGYLGIFNGYGVTGEAGAFFGMAGSGSQGDTFEFWNYQGGPMKFYTVAGTYSTPQLILTTSGDTVIDVGALNVSGRQRIQFGSPDANNYIEEPSGPGGRMKIHSSTSMNITTLGNDFYIGASSEPTNFTMYDSGGDTHDCGPDSDGLYLCDGIPATNDIYVDEGGDTMTGMLNMSLDTPICFWEGSACVTATSEGVLRINSTSKIVINSGNVTLHGGDVDIKTTTSTQDISFSTVGALCFTGNTMVRIPGGEKKMRDVAPGDVLLTVDVVTNDLQHVTVLDVASRMVNSYRLVNHVAVTDEHPFYTPRGWIKAKDLRVGDTLTTERGTDEVYRNNAVFASATVYNVRVSAPHSFIAGGYLVHNKDYVGGDITSLSVGDTGIYAGVGGNIESNVVIGQTNTTEIRFYDDSFIQTDNGLTLLEDAFDYLEFRIHESDSGGIVSWTIDTASGDLYNVYGGLDDGDYAYTVWNEGTDTYSISSAAGNIEIKPDGDTDTYIYYSTNSNEASLRCAGGDCIIEGDDGTITTPPNDILIDGGDASTFTNHDGGMLVLGGGYAQGSGTDGYITTGNSVDYFQVANHTLDSTTDFHATGDMEIDGTLWTDGPHDLYGELRPNGVLCADGEGIIKNASNNWACAPIKSCDSPVCHATQTYARSNPAITPAYMALGNGEQSYGWVVPYSGELLNLTGMCNTISSGWGNITVFINQVAQDCIINMSAGATGYGADCSGTNFTALDIIGLQTHRGGSGMGTCTGTVTVAYD